jgi:lysophospholipase L1-like esterase
VNAKFVFQGLAMAGVAALTGCALVAPKLLSRQQGESVVFIGEEPAALAWCPAPGRPLEVRSSYLRDTNTLIYEAGRDYVVDCRAGTLRRTAGSRLPDFRTNMLFGKQQFDHSRFPGFGNNGFFAFVDYEFAPPARWPVQEAQGDFLKGTLARLRAGQPVKIVAYGDSITAGGDATKPEWVFWRRWADELQRKYPRARIEAVNGATGGDSTVQGLQRLQAKVLDLKPDLVLIGFGMNDHNLNGVPIAQFEANLQEMIGRIRAATGAEVVLFSAFPPNPKWKYGSHRMEQYAEATRRAAAAAGCACADVFSNWEAIARRKKPEDLLGNNINHPNDFGHWIYFQVLEKL